MLPPGPHRWTIWLNNEGLPIRESLFELYLWFCQERGIEWKVAVEDLNVLGEHMRCMKEEQFYKERVRREDEGRSNMGVEASEDEEMA